MGSKVKQQQCCIISAHDLAPSSSSLLLELPSPSRCRSELLILLLLLLGFRPSPLLSSPKAKTDKVSQDGIASPPPQSPSPSISFSSFVVVASLMEERAGSKKQARRYSSPSLPACPSASVHRGSPSSRTPDRYEYSRPLPPSLFTHLRNSISWCTVWDERELSTLNVSG